MKVFCIGLGKTGSTSLNEAFWILGYNSIKFPKTISILDKKDAATDCLVAANFPLLDERYPGSKFIMTVRDKETWIDSQRRWKESGLGTMTHPAAAMVGDECDRWLYGVTDHTYYDEKLMPMAYDRHLAYARWYFKDSPKDYLEINICGGEGWEKLCPFLGKEIPSLPFPYKNKNELKA